MAKVGGVVLVLLMQLQLMLSAQELNCFVEVNHRQIEGSEKVIFEQMQTAIFQLVNGRRWTGDEFQTHELIDCSIIINLTERLSTGRFKGNIQIQASRPIFNTSYKSPIMNVRDENFTIFYNQFEPLQFNVNAYTSELTAIIGFYVYMILGYDYDSYSLEGGTKYFQEAQRIANNAQRSAETGWRSSEDPNNRYWLVENALSARFKPLRKTYYNYHRKGFDEMQKNASRSRAVITNSLKDLKPIHNVAPSSYNLQVFFNAKMQEIVNLYGDATPQEKNELPELLITIDPGNSNNYDKLRK